MNRPKLISGNWKMYKNVAETRAFVQAMKTAAPSGIELAVFAQGPLLPMLQAEARGLLQYGPQSVYWEEKGAFTGELSPALARDLGCTYALSGHSERRQFFGETNETAARRAVATHAFGMKSVFCVGELLGERDAGRTFDVLREQMAPLFAKASALPEGFCVAYEPVWAIGTGRTATSAQAQEAHQFLRGLVREAWGSPGADRVRILYGGSVKPENAQELMSQPDVDGVLVGGASLEPASFLAIAAAGKGC